VRICSRTSRPLSLVAIDRLVIDRKKEYSSDTPKPLICLSMEGTLFTKVGGLSAVISNKKLYKNSVKFAYLENNCEITCTIDIRPGAAELLLQLDMLATHMVYSCESDEFIEAALDAIAKAEVEKNAIDEDFSDSVYCAFSDLDIWSVDQCIYQDGKFLKSLGVLSDFVDHSINDVWIIDDKPEQVDFPSHAIAVSSFNGDPEDRELFRLMHQIFIN